MRCRRFSRLTYFLLLINDQRNHSELSGFRVCVRTQNPNQTWRIAIPSREARKNTAQDAGINEHGAIEEITNGHEGLPASMFACQVSSGTARSCAEAFPVPAVCGRNLHSPQPAFPGIREPERSKSYSDQLRGHEVAARFEQMRAVFGELLMRKKLRMSEPIEIIAIGNDKNYAQLAPLVNGQPAKAPGFFLAGEDRIFVVLNLFEPDSWRAIEHQFAHYLLNYNYPPTQLWFDEG